MSENIASNMVDTVGNTPLIKVHALAKDCVGEVLVKAEFFNPLFSVKDRIGKAMVEAAEKDGSLKPGGTIIEPTSGNTGISFAFVARAKGYKCILVMPATMSIERRILLDMLGAEIVLTPGPKGMGGAISKAKQLVEEHGEGAFMPGQFDNPANPQVHRETTAEEIWRDTDGKIDVFIAGVGTGGTLTGVGEVLKSRCDVKVIALEPTDSAVISGGDPGPHKIQGLGAGFIPGNLNVDIIDETILVSNEDSFETARALSAIEGIPAGISSGAAVWAGIEVAKRPEMKGKRIVVVAPSTTERYLSTALAEKSREKVTALPVHEI